MVPKVKVRKHPGNPDTCLQRSLAVLVNCEIEVLGFSFHCLANEVDSGDRVLHLHMKVSVLLQCGIFVVKV